MRAVPVLNEVQKVILCLRLFTANFDKTKVPPLLDPEHSPPLRNFETLASRCDETVSINGHCLVRSNKRHPAEVPTPRFTLLAKHCLPVPIHLVPALKYIHPEIRVTRNPGTSTRLCATTSTLR